jgi:6-phosphofructokinase 1
MLDPVTGRARVRMVDTESQSYQIARQYMIRLEEGDFNDPARLSRHAALVHLSPGAFAERFSAGVTGKALS